MNPNYLLRFISLLVVTISGSASADGSNDAPRPARSVPVLKIVVDCECNVKESVSAIADGYNYAVSDTQAQIVPNLQATYSIKHYSARNNVARFLIGMLSGKDEIDGVVTFQGKSIPVGDYVANAASDMDALAHKVGILIFEALTKEGLTQ
jgi:hypothetical protein